MCGDLFELYIRSFVFKRFCTSFVGSAVKWFTDNQAVSLIVESGSMKEHLPQLVVDIFHTARKNIEIDVQWVLRLLNERADYLSKIVDYDDWIVKIAIFVQSPPSGGPVQLTVLLVPLAASFVDFNLSTLIRIL